MDVSTRATGKAVGLTRSMYNAGTRRWSRLAFGLCYCFQIYSITIPAAGSSARYPLDQGDPEPAVAARWRAEPKQATQSVRARIWSTVAAVTKLPSTRICHPPPSARNTAWKVIDGLTLIEAPAQVASSVCCGSSIGPPEALCRRPKEAKEVKGPRR